MDLTCSAQADLIVAPLPAKTRSLRSWIVPDVAMLMSLLTVIWCLFLFDGTQQLFRDSDTGWHIRAGEAILDGKGLPRVDNWSLTRSGQSWFAWEWGADVLMGAAHRLGGMAWVAGLYALVLAACTWVWFHLNWAAGGHFLLACLLAIPLLTTSNIHWHARPHVFGWLLCAQTVLYFERPRRRLLGVALLSAVWANFHPSFFLLPVIAGIYAVSRTIEPLIWTRFSREESFADARWYAAAAATGLAATLLNPYGWHVHQHVWRYLNNAELLSRIGEFQTFNFHSEGTWQLILTMGIAALGAAAALIAKRPSHFLLISMLLAMGLRSARTLPLVAIICLPLANGALTLCLREWQGLQPRLRKQIDNFLQYGANLRRLELGFTGTGAALVLFAAAGWALRMPAVQEHAGFPSGVFPVQAAAEVEKLPMEARILAPDLFGGYLIYRFDGRRKVFFDGRSDFYGVGFMKDYLRLIEVRPGWESSMAGNRFTHALLPNRYSLVPALQRIGWRKLYSDKVATLLAAPQNR